MKDSQASKAIRSLHPLVLIFVLILIAALLTYIIPAGQFDRADDINTGKTAVVAGSYHQVESNPTKIGDLLMSVNKGLIDSASIIAFLMLIGGAFSIVSATGAISSLMSWLVLKFKSDRGKGFLIVILIAFFEICAGTFGMNLECLVFVPFLIALMIGMGYDPLVGIAIPVIGCNIGYGAAYLNPFSLGIAQGIAELPFTSGVGVRIGLMVGFLVISSFFIIKYANSVKKDPSKSLCMPGAYEIQDAHNLDKVEFTGGQKRVLVVFALSIVVLIYGTSFKSFFMPQCSTVFLIMGILAGAVNKMKPSDIATAFVNGVKDMALPCLLVGFARAITNLLDAGLVMDTIVYGLAAPLQNMSPLVCAPLMAIVQTLVNFFISSGSAQAVVMMPLMVPIADILEVNRQVAVLAYQIGDGLSNMFWITGMLMLISIGMAKVSYTKWLKFVSKIFFSNLALGMIVLVIAQALNWGPF
ncbi:MAG: Na+/H+ antiporter NhaC family protein [Clostridiales bacterium]